MTAPADPFDPGRALRADGPLGAFNAAGVLAGADVHVARTLGRLADEPDERVLLAVALAVRAVRLGSVCLDLALVRGRVVAETEEAVDLDGLPWPAAPDWLAACAASPLVAVGPHGGPDRPVRLVEGLVYLDRYWRQEQLVRRELELRAARAPAPVDAGRLAGALRRLFRDPAPDLQRLAVAACVAGSVTVVAGGPGTGKTTTVARLLALLPEVFDPPPRVALAAPTGKAAARLTEALAAEATVIAATGVAPRPAPAATTLHRLLGSRPDSRSRFRHDRNNRLPFDLVVVDETSMVSLTLMSRLFEAVRPDTRLVLLGDPDQLASVEAGAVLGDLVHRPPRPGPDRRVGVLAATVPADLAPREEVEAELANDVVRLRRTYRFGGAIDELAAAIRTGDADAVLSVLRRPSAELEFVEDADLESRSPAGLAGLRADVEATGLAVAEAARAGDVPAALRELEGHRLLCAHRSGPYGVDRWSAAVQTWLAAAVPGSAAEGEWYRGRPLLVTANHYELHLFNGDTGVVVDGGPRGPLAAFARGERTVLLGPDRLPPVQTVHALTVHRAQGSQFRRVSVLLPPAGSPLATRELFYTAATRAREFVRVVGTEAAVRAAVARPVLRASGLRRRVAG